MKNFHQSVLEVLEAAKKKIISISVSEHEGHGYIKRRVIDDLNKTITAIGITNNSEAESDSPTELPKVKTMLGKHIGPAPVTPPVPAPTPAEQVQERKVRKDIQAGNEADLFVQRVELIYPEFNKMSNEEIFNSLSDMEIRGVARKAGLSFTETDPKIITTGAIAEIREAIEKRAEIDSQVSAAKESLKETDTVQKPAATDTVTTDTPLDARSLLEKLYREQPSELADMADEDKCFYVKNHIYDGYGEWLISGTKNTASYKSDSEGLQARSLRLYYYGIQVIPKETDVITEGSDATLTVREDKTKGAETGNDKEGKKEAPNAKKKPGI